jgi:mycoredoxin
MMLRTDLRSARPAITDRYAPIVLYGTRWCAASQMLRRHLDRLGVPYIYRDMERDPEAARQVRWWTGGYFSHPTVQIGGDILVEPRPEEVEWALARNGVI